MPVLRQSFCATVQLRTRVDVRANACGCFLHSCSWLGKGKVLASECPPVVRNTCIPFISGLPQHATVARGQRRARRVPQ